MSNIDPAEALNQVKASLGLADYEAAVKPVVAKLTTDQPSTTRNGTEVRGNGYAAQQLAAGTNMPNNATSLPIRNSNTITWANLPAVAAPGIQGIEIWDSAPKRKWFGSLAVAKVVADGDSLSIPTSQLSITTG